MSDWWSLSTYFAWLGNPWFIGVTSGVVSSVFGTLLVGRLFSRRTRNENARKVNLANKDVVYALRQGIPDNLVPKVEVVESLIRATARRHEVEPSGLFDIDEIREELVKEIMDSSFISTSTKSEYCEQLLSLKTVKATDVGCVDALATDVPSEEKGNDLDDFKTRVVSMLSISLAAIMTFSVVVFQLEDVSPFEGTLLPILAPLTIGFAVMLSVLAIFRLWTRTRFIQIDRQSKSEKEV